MIYVRSAATSDAAAWLKDSACRPRKSSAALAARLGYLVIAVLCDNDVSAYSGKPRPQYLKMMELLLGRWRTWCWC